MIVVYHVIFGTYGFWLPNDPRGSWSDFVGSWNLFRYGPATKTTETRSLAYRSHDRAKRLAAKEALKYPAVVFNGIQARAVAIGFGTYARKKSLSIYACSVMPDHIHLVIGACEHDIEQIVIQLKGAATEELLAQAIHPFQNVRDTKGCHPKAFARGEWKVFLDPEDVLRAILYVEDNPVKEGMKPQKWSFVKPYLG